MLTKLQTPPLADHCRWARRRRKPPAALLAVAVAVTLAACSDQPRSADQSPGPSSTPTARQADGRAPFVLPAPTGPHQIGTTEMHLVDDSRPDPWQKTQPHRELMVQLWYPATTVEHYPVAPWMPAGAAASFHTTSLAPMGVPATLDASRAATHGHQGAPVAPHPGGWPVVLFSPGGGVDRAMGTVLVEELASAGYLVVAIDHTHDANEVEFPGGRVETAHPLPPSLQTPSPGPIAEAQVIVAKELYVRVADTRFVLDQLEAINRGDNPDAEHRALPAGLRGALQLTSIGMYGHSVGGATAAQVMHEDPRIIAGVDLDGSIFGSVADAGLSQPFMLMVADENLSLEDTWRPFVRRSRGWHRELKLAGAAHFTFTDAASILPQIASTVSIAPKVVREEIGTIDGARAIAIERAYLTAFFHWHLGGGPTDAERRLLQGPSSTYPELTFGL